MYCKKKFQVLFNPKKERTVLLQSFLQDLSFLYDLGNQKKCKEGCILL